MRHETTRRQHCPLCNRVTLHSVTTFYDGPAKSDETVYYCMEHVS